MSQSIFERFGVNRIINAKGPATRLSGGIMDPAVADAMREATQACVDMGELQGCASDLIARATGAEAGYVTSGAAAGLLLGTAACVTGHDPSRINRLPDTRGMPNEVVVVRSQRNFYDHAVRAAGVELVEVGLADRYSGAGVRDAEAWEIADAICERTACVLYVAQPQSRPALGKVTEVAHDAGVPVLVDAAAQLPPVGNLRRFIDEGADLVAFSGGKALNGPQGSGVLCGRRDLVAAAALNNLDHDIFFEHWRPPAALFAGLNLKGLPQHGIGRACKVGKEQIVGLLVALERFDEAGVRVRQERSAERLAKLRTRLAPSIRDATALEHGTGGEPRLRLALPASAPLGAFDLIAALQDSRPSIHADPSFVDQNAVVFAGSCFSDDDAPLIADRVNELLRSMA